jgi:hypothetical protein
MESHSKVTTAIVTLVIGLLVGGGVGWWIADMNKDDHHSMDMSQTTGVSEGKPNASTKAADLRSTLVSSGTEHMDLVYVAVASALQGSKSAEADKAALINNGHNIGAAVGSIYGKDAETTFDKVWDIHLTQFVNYAVASSKGDEAGKKAALATIDKDYTHPLAAFLAGANPNLPEDVLYSSLNEHVKMTADMIDQIASGDYKTAEATRATSVKHIEGLFSTLAAGIVKQFPDKF